MRRVLITGANRGLGLELVRQCLARGDQVFAGVRDYATARELILVGAAVAGRFTIVPLDVADESSIRGARRAVGAEVDGLDLLINNAGISAGSKNLPDKDVNRTLGHLQADALLHLLRVNAVGATLVAQAFVDLLAHGDLLGRGQPPVIVNISSVLASIALKTQGGNYSYAASKAALNMLTHILAHDVAPRGIIAVAMNPGWVSTDMGGPNAPLTAAQSAAGILGVVDRLSLADAGRFLDWQGSEQPW